MIIAQCAGWRRRLALILLTVVVRNLVLVIAARGHVQTVRIGVLGIGRLRLEELRFLE